jgi:hypothetical protein
MCPKIVVRESQEKVFIVYWLLQNTLIVVRRSVVFVVNSLFPVRVSYSLLTPWNPLKFNSSVNYYRRWHSTFKSRLKKSLTARELSVVVSHSDFIFQHANSPLIIFPTP